MEKKKSEHFSEEDVNRVVRNVKRTGEHNQLLAIKESLEAFAKAHHKADYFCIVLIPDKEAGGFRHAMFKKGKNAQAIAKAVRDLPLLKASY